ncbi:hypothetical protein Dip510_001825 [Elusimicrobium posterum]|uniref:hypothetical protein n=1 Tax=Elusimicrobium posterum TaxID=3116653 RepID=UPI003C71841F
MKKQLFALIVLTSVLGACITTTPKQTAQPFNSKADAKQFAQEISVMEAAMEIVQEKDDLLYGYTPEKPIFTGDAEGIEFGIRKAYILLGKYLRDPDGLPFEVKRSGNIGNYNGDGILDKYQLTRSRTGRSIYVYVNSYKATEDGKLYAPAGMGYLPNKVIALKHDDALVPFLEGKKRPLKKAF